MIKLLRKTVAPVVAVAAMTIAAPMAQAQDVVDGIAAIVNETVITYSQVKMQVDSQEKAIKDALRDNPDEMKKRVKALRLEALNALIERQLILQEFQKNGFEMPERYVEARFKEILDQQYGGNRTALIKTLEAQNMTLDEFKRDLRENMIVQAMRQQNVNTDVIVSPFRVEQYYQEHIQEFVRPDQIKLKMIFIRRGLFREKIIDKNGNEVEIDAQRQLADDIMRKLNSGSDFSSLAAAYSEENKRNQGGDWGWIDRSTLRKELSDVAFRLRPGETSPVITTEEGYYILQVYDFKKGEVQQLEQVRDRIEGIIANEQRLELQRQWLDQLRAKAYIKIF